MGVESNLGRFYKILRYYQSTCANELGQREDCESVQVFAEARHWIRNRNAETPTA